jgi:hypothetical protein
MPEYEQRRSCPTKMPSECDESLFAMNCVQQVVERIHEGATVPSLLLVVRDSGIRHSRIAREAISNVIIECESNKLL